MQKKWTVKDAPNKEAVKELKKTLGVSTVVAEMLVRRDILTFEKAKAFFRPHLDQLHDPFLMKDMRKAVERLSVAFENKEKVLVYGDYDVDGTTAVALVYTFLNDHGFNCEFYIPDRYDEGYGVSIKGIDYACNNDFSLIISLDCGIKAIDQVEYAKSKKVDFIICDHHTPGNDLPDAIVLDPKRQDCDYPYKELSGCGVGFKLVTAYSIAKNSSLENCYNQLDLLAISIAADIVPITGENRTLCALGLEKINKRPRVGISKMLSLAQKELPLKLTDIVFGIAPRINAAGRMGDAKKAVVLLMNQHTTKVKELAEEIHTANEERKAADEQITAEALAQIEEDPDHEARVTTVVFDKDWHKGVIGIVASRLIEVHYRPTVVFSQNNDEQNSLTASARSVKGINVYNVLENCSDLLEQFGGHYYAAGLKILPENLAKFKLRFEKEVRSLLDGESLQAEQIIEKTLDFNEIFKPGENLFAVPQIKRVLDQFEPHGPGNMKPVFLSHNVYAKQAKLLKDQHLKLTLFQPKSNVMIEAILFNRPEAYTWVNSGDPFSIAYTLEVNEWKGKRTLQMNLKDLRMVNKTVETA